MKIQRLCIRNFRSIREVTVEPGNILGLVGRNNSGKSNVLKALRLFFEASTRLVNEECFFNHETDRPIEIVATFGNLSPWERQQFGPWMDGDQLTIGRRITCDEPGRFSISQVAHVRVPKVEWLRDDLISGNSITEWWQDQASLTVKGLDFTERLGDTKPRVGDWKDAAAEFVEEHRALIPTEVKEIKNPRGYANVLKGTLPEFVYVPAVRDITDETKVAKTNPFGQLINSMLDRITDAQKQMLAERISEIERALNRGSDGRFDQISQIEERLNELIGELIDCDIEIEMTLPRLEEVFGGAKIYADDGIRTSIESKGHGLQRSMIFTILRAYSELAHELRAGEMAAERSTIFAIEEPELYLHPQFQRTLMNVFREIARSRDQIFYSTQSNLFIDIQHFDEICIMRRIRETSVRESKSTQLSVAALIEDLRVRKGVDATEEGMRELYAHAFNPVVNEGFFADKVIIVEGLSEVYSIPEYALALGWDFDRENISIIPADGKGPIDRLLRIFTGFGIPTYVVFDGDKTNDDSSITGKTLELLELFGAPQGSIDDIETKIEDYYAVFESNYDKLLQGEIDDYQDLTQEATELLGPIGKPLRNRYIAKAIRTRVDGSDEGTAHVPATIRTMLERIQQLNSSVRILQDASTFG